MVMESATTTSILFIPFPFVFQILGENYTLTEMLHSIQLIWFSFWQLFYLQLFGHNEHTFQVWRC